MSQTSEAIVYVKIMKPQDIIFFLIFIFVLIKKDAQISTVLGLFSLLLATVLFATWTFFTAERLTWYGGAFFFLAIVFLVVKSHNEK